MKNKRFLEWNVYQIYPRSFMDSNGDGIGDIKGITSKLDYLKELGINAVWLSPCYKSPNCDNGYDIADYRDIMDEFGTLDDWKEMIAGMHARGIKLIMDYVGNHTSSEHEWFKKARTSRGNPYHDYYIWRDTPPNDWQSCFRGSAWEYNELTNEYYLHSFAIGQPDLNWENPKVRKEMCDIIDYWVDLGVDGFRCDVIGFIAKDFEKGLMQNGPKLHEYIHELFGREKVKNIFTVGENSMGMDSIMDICGEDRDELKCIFQFDHIDHGRSNKYLKVKPDIDKLKNTLVKWQYFTEENNLLYTLFTDNHDQPHFINRGGYDGKNRYEVATMYATMFYLLKGIPFIYQGQEFGTLDPHYDDIADFNDIETINYYNDHKEDCDILDRINVGSRDNARRPLCWNNTKNYGFSTADKTWIKLHSQGKEINLENDRKSDKSVFAYYQKLLALRNTGDVVKYGKFADLTIDDGYFAYTRTLDNEIILVVCNFDKEKNILNLPVGKYIFGNGSAARATNGKYAPFEAAVFNVSKME
ncbi:MAG: alpha-glucosidase [Victivallis sp.]